MTWYSKYASDYAEPLMNRAEQHAARSDNPFASWFPAGKKRNFFRLKSGDTDFATLLTPEDRDVIEMLAGHGYKVDAEDYVAGYAVGQNGRKIRIGKILPRVIQQEIERSTAAIRERTALDSYEDPDERDLVERAMNDEIRKDIRAIEGIRRQFINSPARQKGAADPQLWAVVSRDPHDIATMSHERNWTSCMDLDGGSYSENVWAEIEAGSLVAYVVFDGDWEIERPLARIHIKRFQDLDGNNIALPEDTVYGQNIQGFEEAVKQWLESRQGDVPPGIYKRVGGEYSDTFGKSHVRLPADPQVLVDIILNGIDEDKYAIYKVMSQMPDDLRRPYEQGYASGYDEDEIQIAEFRSKEEAESYVREGSYDETWRQYWGDEWLEEDEEGNFVREPYRIEKEVLWSDSSARFDALSKLIEMPADAVSREQAEAVISKGLEMVERGSLFWKGAIAGFASRYPGILSPEEMMQLSVGEWKKQLGKMEEGPEKERARDVLANEAAEAAAEIRNLLEQHPESARFPETLSKFNDALGPIYGYGAGHDVSGIWSRDHQPNPEAVASIVGTAAWLYENGPDDDFHPGSRIRYLMAAAQRLTAANSDIPVVIDLVSTLVSNWIPLELELKAGDKISPETHSFPSIATLSYMMPKLGDAAKQFLPIIEGRAAEAKKKYQEAKADREPPVQRAVEREQAAAWLWRKYLRLIDAIKTGAPSKKYPMASWLEKAVLGA